MAEQIEALARKLALDHGDWKEWDSATSFLDTPGGNEPEEEREYWRGIARTAYAAGREAMREEASTELLMRGGTLANDGGKSAEAWAEVMECVRAIRARP